MDNEPTPPPVITPQDARRQSIPALTVFLSERDAACAECGYPLHSVGNDKCPECGWAIAIQPVDGIDRTQLLWLARRFFVLTLVLSSLSLVRVGAYLVGNWAYGGIWPSLFTPDWILHTAGQGLIFLVSIFALTKLGRRALAVRARILITQTRWLFRLTWWVFVLVSVGLTGYTLLEVLFWPTW